MNEKYRFLSKTYTNLDVVAKAVNSAARDPNTHNAALKFIDRHISSLNPDNSHHYFPMADLLMAVKKIARNRGELEELNLLEKYLLINHPENDIPERMTEIAQKIGTEKARVKIMGIVAGINNMEDGQLRHFKGFSHLSVFLEQIRKAKETLPETRDLAFKLLLVLDAKHIRINSMSDK